MMTEKGIHVCISKYILVRASDKRVTGEGEYSDSEDEGERKDRANYKPKAKRMKTENEEKKDTAEKGRRCTVCTSLFFWFTTL